MENKKNKVYFIVTKDNEVKYVGYTNDLATRVESHLSGGQFLNTGDSILYFEVELDDVDSLDMVKHLRESMGLEYDFIDGEYDGNIVDEIPKKIKFTEFVWEGDK